MSAVQQTFFFSREFTVEEVLPYVPAEWGRLLGEPPRDHLAWPHPAFSNAIRRAIEFGLVERRDCHRARHFETGEERTWYSTDPDWPPGDMGARIKFFHHDGSEPTKRRPWKGNCSFCEWRLVAAERAA